MDLHPPLEDVAAGFAAACDERGIEYAVIGGIAAGAHASGVATADVDGVVALSPGDAAGIDAFLHALEARGFRANVEAMNRRAGRGRTILFLWIGLVRLDIMLRRPDGYWADALRHRRRARVGGREIWVAAPEDVVALKLAAGREKDVEAARRVLRNRYRHLDLARLRALAARLAPRVPELPAKIEALLAEANELDRLAGDVPEGG